jgi:hypothetical protein
MGLEAITQTKIDELIKMPKKVINPNARSREKPSHLERNYKVVGVDDNNISFSLFIRQNNQLEDDFSCGLIWHTPSGEGLVLTRYNGASHPHKNHLEGERLEATYHIHKATEKYLQAGKKAEGYAETTNRYTTANGALHCLLKDCNISGLTNEENTPRLL